MKVIIAGSRHMHPSLYPLIHEAVQASQFDITEVVSGRARGADRLGEEYAKEHNIPCRLFPADWGKHGRAAGPIRNTQMKNYADAAIIFIWNDSRGSENMHQQMLKANKPVFVVRNGYVSTTS